MVRLLAVDNANGIISTSVTNAAGVYASDNWRPTTTSGGTTTEGTAVNGFLTWLRFSRITTQGTTTFGTNPFGLTTTPGLVIVPFEKAVNAADVGFTADYRRDNFTVQEEARSYRFDLAENLRTVAHPNGRVSFNDQVLTGTTNVIDLVGTQLVTTNEATSLGHFNTVGTRSVQEGLEWLRANWSTFNAGFDFTPSITYRLS